MPIPATHAPLPAPAEEAHGAEARFCSRQAVAGGIWSYCTDPRARKAVEVAERCAKAAAPSKSWTLRPRQPGKHPWKAGRAGGRSPETQARAASRLAETMDGRVVPPAPYEAALLVSRQCSWVVARSADPTNLLGQSSLREAARLREHQAQADIVRDLFGPPPFRPIGHDPAWLTPLVVSIAEQACDRADFAALPILADALEDAGCDDPVILSHCRSEGGPRPRLLGPGSALGQGVTMSRTPFLRSSRPPLSYVNAANSLSGSELRLALKLFTPYRSPRILRGG